MTDLLELPPIDKVMDINEMHIDATPKGYALRILRAYRRRCDEKWVVTGFEECERIIYDKMNEDQDMRAKELDIAIAIMECVEK